MKFKWLVSKFCYCIDLRMGAKILGCVSFVCSFFVILFCCSTIENSQTEDDEEFTEKNNTLEVAKRFLTHIDLYDDPETSRIVLCSITIFLQSCSMISACCLLAGAIKLKKELLVPWLLIHFLTLLYIVFFILYEIVDSVMDGTPFIKFTFEYLSFLVICIYLWICILSFYKKLQEDGRITMRALSRAETFTGDLSRKGETEESNVG